VSPMRPIPVLAALVMLTGCTQAAAPVVTVTSVATTTVGPDEPVSSPTGTPTPTTDAEGYVLKNVGDMASMIGQDGTTYVRFRVTKIVPGFKCTAEGSDKPENGHYVGIWMEIWTDKAVGGDDVGSVDPTDWSVTGPTGITENDSSGNGYSCARDADALQDDISGAKHVRGVVVLDSKYTSGSLVFRAGLEDSGGFKYSFGS